MSSKANNRFGTFNVGAMTRQVLRWHDRATAEQVQDGATWYDVARRFAAAEAERTGYGVEQVAGVIAVLSPQVDWPANMRATTRALDMHRAGATAETITDYAGYRANVAKAWRVLDGDASAVRGPKVEAFAAAIRGDMSHVVVDAWAIRAARSTQRAIALAWLDVEQDGTVEKRAIAEAYRRAAALRGIEPATMQAIVWVTVRASEEWRRPRTEAERTRFYRRQARARVAQGMPPMHSYWQNDAKRAKVAAAIAGVAA